MTDTTPVKKLVVDNDNNKKACPVFTVIHLAPPVVDTDPPNEVMQLQHGPMLGKQFVIDTDTGTAIVELVHYEMMPMVELTSAHTLPASGLEYLEWRDKFISKFPETTHTTKMAVYCYRKVMQ